MPAFLKTGLTRDQRGRGRGHCEILRAAHPEAHGARPGQRFEGHRGLLDAVGRSALSEEAKYNIRHELEIKRVQFNDALAEALGLSICRQRRARGGIRFAVCDVMGDPETFRVAIPGQKFGVKVHAVNQSGDSRDAAKP